MSSEAFTNALAQGRGLAALALQQGDPTRYTDAILNACVENLQFDRQCEANRALYMMRLLDLADLRAQALDRILAALPTSEEGWDRDWMIDLLETLAAEGDERAWDALRDLAACGEERAQNNLATSGEAGLQWIAEHVLPSLSEEDRWRIVLWLPDEEADDVTPLQRRLRRLDEERLAALQTVRNVCRGLHPPTPSFLRSLAGNTASRLDAVRFMRNATPSQWRSAARRFLRETCPRPLRVLARTFRDRKFPLPARRLFRQARHPERGGEVMEILGTLDAPAVRQFALGLLRRRPLPWSSLTALRSTLRPGDESLLLRAVRSTENESNTTRHDPILDLIYLMHKHPALVWQPHAEWIVEHSPCSMCRGSAIDWMIEHGTVPEAFRKEAPYDAEPDVRKAVASLTAP